jgi:acetyl-CoA carboxylase carboxyl transferase subunit beta
MKFKKPTNILEGTKPVPKVESVKKEFKDITICDSCKQGLPTVDVQGNQCLCKKCGYHFKISARTRLLDLADAGTFSEHDAELQSKNILGFEGYDSKIEKAKTSGECEGVVTATAKINKIPVALFAMEAAFMMGSMGSIVGEKITRIIEHATANKLPLIGFAVSGGARMQEGILSLMQMAKTSSALKRHSTAGLLYISVLTNPTTGGVTASFASLGDIIIAEPGALIGFAGPRVIEQTIRRKLPEGFQSAEFMLEKGFVDIISPRNQHRELLCKLLDMHKQNVVK